MIESVSNPEAIPIILIGDDLNSGLIDIIKHLKSF